MPPRDPVEIVPTAGAPFPRTLGRLEKEFVAQNARVAAAIMFGLHPKPKEEVVAALREVLATHPVAFTHLDASKRKIDWRRDAESVPSGEAPMPDLDIREETLPGVAATGFASGIPREFMDRKASKDGGLDITLLRASISDSAPSAQLPDIVSGLVVNASRAMIDMPSLVSLVERIVQRLSSVAAPSSGVVGGVSPPGQLDRQSVMWMFGGRELPAQYLGLDSATQLASDDPKAIAAAAKFEDRTTHVADKEAKDREKVLKEERADLEHVFSGEHRAFADQKKAEETALHSEAAILADQRSALAAVSKNLQKISADEEKARFAVAKEEASELKAYASGFREEASQHQAATKVLKQQAKVAEKERKILEKDAKKFDKFAKQQDHLQKKPAAAGLAVPSSEAPAGGPAVRRASERNIQQEMRSEAVALHQNESELRGVAAVEHTTATQQTRHAALLEKHAKDNHKEVKKFEAEKKRAVKVAVVDLKKQQDELKKREKDIDGEAGQLRDERKSHPKTHGALLNQQADEATRDSQQQSAQVSQAAALRMLSVAEVFGKVKHADHSGGFIALPASTISAISRNSNGFKERFSAYVAAGFAIGIISQAHSRGILREHFEKGGERVGIPVAIAVDLRNDCRELQRTQGFNFPLQCTGFVTVGIVFTRDELRQAIGDAELTRDDAAGTASRDISSNFDLAAIAGRVEADIKRRIARGEAHRQALGLIEGNSSLFAPPAAFAVTNLGMLRDADGFHVELRQLHESAAEGTLQAGGIHVVTWGSTTEGHVHLSMEGDESLDQHGWQTLGTTVHSLFVGSRL